MTSRQFDCFSKHHAQGDVSEMQLIGYFQCIADIVAVFNEGLTGKVWIYFLDEALALATTIDHHTL